LSSLMSRPPATDKHRREKSRPPANDTKAETGEGCPLAHAISQPAKTPTGTGEADLDGHNDGDTTGADTKAKTSRDALWHIPPLAGEDADGNV
jgi:hypothetical protein